jgi:predicted DNA-binding transcriptional regulator YafY
MSSEKRGRKKGDHQQARRVFALLDHLSARRVPVRVRELAVRFEVGPRQMKRDLKFLEEQGYELERSHIDRSPAVRLRGSRAPYPLRLSLRERYTLLAVRRVFDVLEGTPFATDVQSIFDKVVASLPRESDHPERLADRFAYLPDGGTKGYAGSEAILDQLLSGVLYGHRVDCAYRSIRGNERAGTMEPYAIVVYRHGLYVVGAFDDGSGIRVYAVERFQRAERLRRESFERPAEFSLDDYFEGAFGVFTGGEKERVVLDLSPAVGHLAEHRTWHPSQRVTALEDGWTRLELEVAVGGHPKA